MNKTAFRAALLLIFLLPGFFPGRAAPIAVAAAAAGPQAQPPAVLCLPGVYLSEPGDCSPAGPSAYLTQMAKIGITFPLSPLAYTPADPALAAVDLHYGKVVTDHAPVYGSLDDAVKKNKKSAVRTIDTAFSYISYQEEQIVGGKRYYMVDSNGWMTSGDISRIGAFMRFQGITFNQTPPNEFGWVRPLISPTPETKRTPGDKIKDYTGHKFQGYALVQIFATEKVGDVNWYMVAPDEWLPQRAVGRVIPNSTPPKGVTGDRWIEVNLFEQTLSVYDHNKLVFATLVATGAEPLWTQPGVFQIKQKLPSTMMKGVTSSGADSYYLEDVPWTMYYDGARALHGAYWRAYMGFEQSHGCVNMTIGDAHWIFDWANEGDWVYVWDPSGKTPTDPSLYTGGGY